MSVSPFTALSKAERHIKWLEYQSVRLPYVHGNVDAPPEMRKQKEPHVLAKEPEQSAEPVKAKHPEAVLKQKPDARQDFQKTSHRQYDAVIARMRQAEQFAKSYQKLP